MAAEFRVMDSEGSSHIIGDHQFRTLLECLPGVAIQGYDNRRVVVYWNEASSRLYGYSAEEAMGRKLEDLLIPENMRDHVIAAHTALVQGQRQVPPSEVNMTHKSGISVPVFSQQVKLETRAGAPLVFCVDIDLSQEHKVRQRLEYLRRYDELTHLLCRQSFESGLQEVLAMCEADSASLAVMYLDLDGFQDIKENYGYTHGDSLLTLVAFRLRHHLRKEDLIARFSNDEFVMAFPHVLREQVEAMVGRLLREFTRSFMVGNGRVHIGASLGISVFPEHGVSATELIRNAELAKARAKRVARGKYLFFDQEFHQQRVQQHRMEARLRTALNNGELALYYQPQVDVATARVRGLEALLRWHPNDGNSVPPGEFIPVAERSNLIHLLGDWVLTEACRQQAEWKAAGVQHCRVDINLSGKQLGYAEVFRNFEKRIREYQLTPEDIGIELTENVLIQADEGTLDGLRMLHGRGTSIALDDFGTGYSSLSYLKQFPVTTIKIDRSFVQGASATTSDRAIMEATVLIGHRLGLTVVAEGVEDEVQLNLVRELGCDLVQGFYFHKPMPGDDVTRLLSDLQEV